MKNTIIISMLNLKLKTISTIRRRNTMVNTMGRRVAPMVKRKIMRLLGISKMRQT
jgi:hypothetical protein